MLQEGLQQRELLRRQLDLVVGDLGPARPEIEPDAARLQPQPVVGATTVCNRARTRASSSSNTNGFVT